MLLRLFFRATAQEALVFPFFFARAISHPLQDLIRSRHWRGATGPAPNYSYHASFFSLRGFLYSVFTVCDGFLWFFCWFSSFLFFLLFSVFFVSFFVFQWFSLVLLVFYFSFFSQQISYTFYNFRIHHEFFLYMFNVFKIHD